MGYIKTTWDSETPLSAVNMGHIESQADELEADRASVTHSNDYYTKTQYSKFWSKSTDGPGSGADAEYVGSQTKSQILAAGLPAYTVIMWYGNLANIPAGYLLCAGDGGIPAMIGRIPVGAGYSAPGVLGGKSTATITGSATWGAHTLTVDEMGPHRHKYIDNSPFLTQQSDSNGATAEDITSSQRYLDYAGGGGAHSHYGTSSISSTTVLLPPCKAVYLLVKT